MTDADVLDVTVDMIWCIIKCSAPLLLVSLIVGLVISIFQTVTSIQEQTLTFVPKLLAIFITMLICGGWIMNNCVELFTKLCEKFALYSANIPCTWKAALSTVTPKTTSSATSPT